MEAFRIMNIRWLLLGVCFAGMLLVSGCASTGDEPENMSERPWNAPKSWENSLPGGMMEGR